MVTVRPNDMNNKEIVFRTERTVISKNYTKGDS